MTRNALKVGISLSSLPVNSWGVWVQSSSPRWVVGFVNLFVSLPNATFLMMMKILIPFFKVLEKGLHLESKLGHFEPLQLMKFMGFVVFPKWPRRSPAKLEKPQFTIHPRKSTFFDAKNRLIFLKPRSPRTRLFSKGPISFGYISPAVRFVGGKSPF